QHWVFTMNVKIAKKIADLEPSATEEVDNKVKEMQQNGVDDIISLGVGEPYFDTPDNIKKAACNSLMDGKTNYEPTAGDYELRKEISKKFKRDNDMDVDVDDIIVTPGAKFAIFLAFNTVLEEGDQLMLLEPAWVSYEPAANMNGAEVIRVPTNKEKGFQLDVEAVKEAMNGKVKIIVINTPCNPTGAVFDPSKIREITKIAKEHGALVLSDEPYEYQLYDGEHYSPGSEFDNVITANAFSKSHAMTGWRLGYVTGPKEILEGMIKIYQHSATCVNSFSQGGAIEALRSEESIKSIEEMTEGYGERRELMIELINESEFFDLHTEPKGAFYCFPSYNIDKSSIEFSKELLEETHVATVPGAAFGDTGEGHLRLSYSTSKENIREGFERIENYLRGN
ncbi:MAG: pyridoxal phosphate-dependent aminotransferase, partial [Thermoplasmatota archaeon]